MARNILIVLTAVLFLCAGCSRLRKKTPADRLAALRKEVEPKGGIVFETELAGKLTAFLVVDCSVYTLDLTAEKVKRTKVLSAGFYFGLTVCTGQSIRAERGFVLVDLKNQAIGAGGGNTSGGTYRSKDGLAWEKQTAKGWRPVDEAQM